MNIDELLDLLDETLEESPGLPLTGGKKMVDVDKVRDIIDDVRMNMPGEIKQAKAIVNDRVDIVSNARKESEAIIKKAEERARALVDQEEIVKIAKQRAAELLNAAQQQAREMRGTVTDYCENMLRQTEETMARGAAEVKNVRQTLRQNAKGGTANGQ